MSSPAKLVAEFDVLKVPEVKAAFDIITKAIVDAGVKAAGTTVQFNQAFQAMDQGSATIQRSGNVLTAFGSNMTIASDGVGTFRDGILQLNTGIAPAESSLKNLGRAVLENATSFGVFTASTFGMIASISNMQKQSILVEAQMLRQERASTTLQSAELALQEARDRGNVSAERIAVLEARVEDARARVGIETAKTEISQGNYNEALGAFVTQIVPQMVAAGAAGVDFFTKMGRAVKENNISFSSIGGSVKNAFSHLINFGTGAKDVAASTKNAGTALAGFDGSVRKTGVTLGGLKGTLTSIPWLGIAAGVGVAAAALFAIGTNAGGVRTALDGIGISIGKTVPQIEGFLQSIGTFGRNLDITISGLAGTWNKLSPAHIKSINDAIRQALTDPAALLDDLRENAVNTEGVLSNAIMSMADPAERVTASLAALNFEWDLFQTGKLTRTEDFTNSAKNIKDALASIREEAARTAPEFVALIDSITKGIEGKIPGGVEAFEFEEISVWLGKLDPLFAILQKNFADTGTAAVDLGATFKAGNVLAAGFMADIPPAMLETEKGIALVQAKLKEFIEQLKERAETPGGEWITPEFIAMFETLAGIDLSNTIKQIKDEDKATEDLAKETEELNKVLQENAIIQQQRGEEIITNVRAKAQETQQLRELASAYLDLNLSQSNNFALIDKAAGLEENRRQALESDNTALLELAKGYDLNVGAMIPYIAQLKNEDGTLADTTEQIENKNRSLREIMITQIDYTRALTDSQFALDLVSQGHLDATVNVDAFLQSLVRGRAEQERTDVLLRNIANTMGIELPAAIQLTTEDLNALITEFHNTGSTAITMNEIMTNAFAGARAGVEELVSAAVEGGDNWKDAWKDLDKSFIPKGERGEVKEFIKDMAELETAAKEAATQMGLFQLMFEAGLIDEKEMKKWGKEIAEGLRSIKNELEDIRGEDIANNLVGPFVKLRKDGLSQADINAITAFEAKFAELSEGGITDTELKIMQDYAAALLEAARDAERLAQFRSSGDFDTGMDVEEIDRLEKGEGGGDGDSTTPIPDADAVKTATDKINTALQSSQTAFANLSNEGSNSMSILVDNLKPHVETMNTYFSVTIPEAIRATQAALLALASFGTKGEGKDGLKNISDIPENAGGGGLPGLHKYSLLKISEEGKLGEGEGGGDAAGFPIFTAVTAQIALLTATIQLWIAQNNILDQTIAQIIIDTGLWVEQNNILAQTLLVVAADVTIWQKANDLLARTIVQITKNIETNIKSNNVIAKTIVQIASNVQTWITRNNLLARTLVQVDKNVDTLTSSNNVLARTIVQVGKNFASAADDADDFANALDDVTAAAKKAAAAIKSIPKSGVRGAQHGMNEYLEQDTLIVAHKGESVRIGRGSATQEASRGAYLRRMEVPHLPRAPNVMVNTPNIDVSALVSAVSHMRMPQYLMATIYIDNGDMGVIKKQTTVRLGQFDIL